MAVGLSAAKVTVVWLSTIVLPPVVELEWGCRSMAASAQEVCVLLSDVLY